MHTREYIDRGMDVICAAVLYLFVGWLLAMVYARAEGPIEPGDHFLLVAVVLGWGVLLALLAVSWPLGFIGRWTESVAQSIP